MKAIKINKHHVVLKKGTAIKPFSSKVYTIRGKQYYKIGRNKYVRVADTINANPGKKVSYKFVVKGHNGRKVRLYNQHGKFIKKYAIAGRSYKFDRKMTIKGKVFYRLAGKDQWIPAKKLIIKK